MAPSRGGRNRRALGGVVSVGHAHRIREFQHVVRDGLVFFPPFWLGFHVCVGITVLLAVTGVARRTCAEGEDKVCNGRLKLSHVALRRTPTPTAAGGSKYRRGLALASVNGGAPC